MSPAPCAHPLAFSWPSIAPASSKSRAQSTWPARTALPRGLSPADESLRTTSRSSNGNPSSKSSERVSVSPAAAASCTGDRARAGVLLALPLPSPPLAADVATPPRDGCAPPPPRVDPPRPDEGGHKEELGPGGRFAEDGRKAAFAMLPETRGSVESRLAFKGGRKGGEGEGRVSPPTPPRAARARRNTALGSVTSTAMKLERVSGSRRHLAYGSSTACPCRTHLQGFERQTIWSGDHSLEPSPRRYSFAHERHKKGISRPKSNELKRTLLLHEQALHLSVARYRRWLCIKRPRMKGR